jgi:hypothetical protein
MATICHGCAVAFAFVIQSSGATVWTGADQTFSSIVEKSATRKTGLTFSIKVVFLP